MLFEDWAEYLSMFELLQYQSVINKHEQLTQDSVSYNWENIFTLLLNNYSQFSALFRQGWKLKVFYPLTIEVEILVYFYFILFQSNAAKFWATESPILHLFKNKNVSGSIILFILLAEVMTPELYTVKEVNHQALNCVAMLQDDFG